MNKEELLRSLAERGFSRKIINAFKKVKREAFIAKCQKNNAYEDIALPLTEGSTISQPFTIAFMLNLLELGGKEKILEIGSGSGYVLALLSEMTKGEIYGIEIIQSLAEQSRRIFKNNRKIKIINKNGSKGLPKKAPFDRIIMSAAADKMPTNLFKQLTKKGILVTPVQNSIWQIKKENKTITKKEFTGFVFIPLKK
jgi:protein-L-isoaspartate(D-aspartate) O-methyltransferase